MIQMVLIKQIVPNSKRRRNVFKSCWNEPRAKPISLYKKVLLPWEFFVSPMPHPRERLATCVYLIITIKNRFVCLGCRGMSSASRERLEQPRAGFVCRAKGQRGRKNHIWPLLAAGEKLVPISSRAISHRGYRLGKPGFGICAATAPTCLICSRLDLGSRFGSKGSNLCWEFWNSSAIRQEEMYCFVRLISPFVCWGFCSWFHSCVFWGFLAVVD